MRRALAPFALCLSLATPVALADPLDLQLEALGAPSAAVWSTLSARHGVPLAAGEADQLARDARQRFALLASELGLALTSFVLEPAATTGYLGLEVSLEAAYAPVHPEPVGRASGFGPAGTPWPVRGPPPGALFLPAFHVRKGLPFGFEIGGRGIYLYRSTMMAAQLEARWAPNESWWHLPDFSIRGALTHLFGTRDLDLTAADLDAVVGKRFALGGAMSLAPYGMVRITWIGARSGPIDFGPNPVGVPDVRGPADALATQASFPDLGMGSHRFLRLALGVRLVTGAFVAGLEGCWSPGATFSASASYPEHKVQATLSGALKVGMEL